MMAFQFVKKNGMARITVEDMFRIHGEGGSSDLYHHSSPFRSEVRTVTLWLYISYVNRTLESPKRIESPPQVLQLRHMMSPDLYLDVSSCISG